MNRLINLIINKRINKNINKFTIAKFVNDYKEQFISGKINIKVLHHLHIIMWSRIVHYYEDYTFGPVRINKVKQKILNKMMKDIKKQTSSLHCCDKFEFISNLKSLFRTVHNVTHNCFACYYSIHRAKHNCYYFHSCAFCPIEKWRKNKTCYEYSQLCHLTKNKKDFNVHKSDVISLCKEINNSEWVVINEQNKTK